MAPHQSASESSHDEDSDAPEAVSLSQSRKQVKKLESERKNAELAARQNKRAQNRERDRKLKERAEKNSVKAKGKGKEVEPDGLEARMERAMREAQEESGEDEDEDEMSGRCEDLEGIGMGSDEDEEDSGSDGDSEEDSEEDSEGSGLEGDDGDEEEEGEEKEPPKSQKTKFNPDHLPDELFAAAFASKPKRTADSELDNENETTKRPAKKRKFSNVPKDVVVGSCAIRMLSNSTQPSTPSTLPSRKVKQFLDRTLALKGGKQRAKGWERRPVNIGVLRRDGPAVSFVRNR
ncbi:hypothetical protein BDZ97DRAFT_1374089 [Flammula alnicola]|nr:hypothetical protein BDZ97DRAFT_1374089 [Flammula alnicola]